MAHRSQGPAKRHGIVRRSPVTAPVLEAIEIIADVWLAAKSVEKESAGDAPASSRGKEGCVNYYEL